MEKEQKELRGKLPERNSDGYISSFKTISRFYQRLFSIFQKKDQDLFLLLSSQFAADEATKQLLKKSLSVNKSCNLQKITHQ